MVIAQNDGRSWEKQNPAGRGEFLEYELDRGAKDIKP
jgi:hypothetical protein